MIHEEAIKTLTVEIGSRKLHIEKLGKIKNELNGLDKEQYEKKIGEIIKINKNIIKQLQQSIGVLGKDK